MCYLCHSCRTSPTLQGHAAFLGARAGVPRIAAVDLTPESLNCVRSHSAVKNSTGSGSGVSLRSIVVDVGARPGSSNEYDFKLADAGLFPSVSDMILYETDPKQIDVVFIDGYFRAASLLKAASIVRDDAFIILHDYKDGSGLKAGTRSKVVELVEKSSRLAVFRRLRSGTEKLSTGCASVQWQLLFQGFEKKPFDTE